MKIQTKATTMKSSTLTIGLLVLAASLAWTQPVRGVELIENGSFATGMTGWKVAPKLAGWNPYATNDASVSLSPSDYSYAGILFYQDLNVTNASLASVALTVGLEKNYGSSGNSVAVYLDYATTNLQVKRLMVLNPENASFPDSVYTNLSANISLPAEASKVVRLLVSILDRNSSFNLNLASLSASGLSAAPLPTLTLVFPSTGAYYSTTNSGLITLRGSNLGTTGQVFVGTAPMEVVPFNGTAPLITAQIISWNNTQVVARVVEPMSSGQVFLLSGGVESQGDCYFTITSPLFTFSAVYPESTVLRGQTITAPFRVDLLNGFQSASGLSAMLVSPVYAPPAITPLFRSGGYSFDFDTADLTNGDYIGLAQTLEDNSYARWAPFMLKVRSITNINFTAGYPPAAISSVVVTSQKEFTYDFSYQLVDNLGATFTSSGPAPVTITSDNPSVVMVANGNFGPRLFALTGGAANLLFSTPNGYSKTLPVTVSLPEAPKFTIVPGASPIAADNSGLSTNTTYWQATEDPTEVGYEGTASFSSDGIYYDYVNHAVTWTFGVPEATPPGTYLLHAALDNVTESYATITVVNAASKGQIAGSILTVDSGGFFMHETMGNIEIYNASTGTIVRTNSVGNFNSDTYLASYVTPGSYRVRWVPMGSGTPQWYPQATNFAGAATIQVLAGQTVTNINFYQRPAPTPPSNLSLPAPVANGTERKFHLPTVFGVLYVLEYKDNLNDTVWKTAQSLDGNGSTLVIADPAPTAPRRYYRIRMQTP